MKPHNRAPGTYRPLRSLMACVVITAAMAGCASTPDPAVVCSADWIKPRTDAALKEFTSSTSDTWEKLSKTGRRASKRGSLGLFERGKVLLSLTSLVNSFQNSQALEDLQLLGETCDDPDLAKNALVGTLEDYNVPLPYINLLNEIEGFMKLLDSTADELGASKP